MGGGGSKGKKRKVLLLGLDNAGKTTITYRLKYKATVSTVPTIGLNVEEIQLDDDLTLMVWDLGGQERLRELWKHHLTGTDGLVYVIDSSDEKRLANSDRSAKHELDGVLSDPALEDVPLLVFANKQDVPEALKPADVEHRLRLGEMKNRRYRTVGCIAKSDTDTRMKEGLDWLAEQLLSRSKKKTTSFFGKFRKKRGDSAPAKPRTSLPSHDEKKKKSYNNKQY